MVGDYSSHVTRCSAQGMTHGGSADPWLSGPGSFRLSDPPYSAFWYSSQLHTCDQGRKEWGRRASAGSIHLVRKTKAFLETTQQAFLSGSLVRTVSRDCPWLRGRREMECFSIQPLWLSRARENGLENRCVGAKHTGYGHTAGELSQHSHRTDDEAEFQKYEVTGSRSHH